MNRFKVFFALAFLGFTRTAMATDTSTDLGSRFFTKQVVYSDENYVLNDYLEFSVFDMSKMDFYDGEVKVNLKPVQPTSLNQPQTKKPSQTDSRYVNIDTVPPAVLEPSPTPTAPTGREDEVRTLLPEIPKYFYKNLKSAIVSNKVPITLDASNSPSYAKPLKLYIKLKKISLENPKSSKKGVTVQPVTLLIYGQIKDKASEKILTRFYDQETAEFNVGEQNVATAIGAISQKMMLDLAGFLRTKY